MEYVRYKLDKVWWDDTKRYGENLTKNGYYFYPYFISDNKNTWSGLLTEYKNENGIDEYWRFQFIKEETFIKKNWNSKRSVNIN